MKDHKAIHDLVGIENIEGQGFHHPHFHLAKFVPMGEGLYAGGGGLYANAGASGGRLSKIGNAFDKAFNPKKNGLLKSVSNVVDKNIVKPIEHSGKQILNDAKVVGHYVIPATISTLGGLAGGLATGGNPLGAIAGSATGAYAGDQVNRALGIQGNTSFGKGVRRGRPPKGGNIKKELEKVWEKVPHEFHRPLEDLGRAGIEFAGFKLPPRKHERGRGVKGCPSKTRKGDMDYTTKKGDKDYHRGGHDESEPESENDQETGGSLKKQKRPHLIKGSEEAKKFMAEMRAKRKVKGKVSGSGLSQNNNSPQQGHIRVSPYSNF
jgi:hypothetical protein